MDILRLMVHILVFCKTIGELNVCTECFCLYLLLMGKNIMMEARDFDDKIFILFE